MSRITTEAIHKENSRMTTMPVEAVLLTVEEAADRLRIGRTTMYALVSSGAVESVKVGRLRRVPIECVDAYVTVLRTTSQPATVAA
jgi:excisionase family DNA binding protein